MKGISSRVLKDCILFKIKVEYDRELFNSFIQMLKNTLDINHLTNAIVDLRSIKGDIPFMDRYVLAKSIAAILPSKYKLAVLYDRTKITKFAENVAVNRGAYFFVSHDMKEIKDWFKK